MSVDSGSDARELTSLVAELERARLAGEWGRVLRLVGIGPERLAEQLLGHGVSLPELLVQARLGALRLGEITWSRRASMAHADAAVRDIRFARDGGRILSCAEDGEARMWWADGDPVWRAAPRRGRPVSVALDAGDRWISRALGDRGIEVWRDPFAGAGRTIPTRSAVRALAPAAAGLVGAACGETVELCDLAAGEWRYPGHRHPAPVLALRFTGRAEEIMVSGCADRGVRLWSVARGEPLITRRAPGPIADVVTDGRGRTVVVRLTDGGACYWPAFEANAEPVRLTGAGGAITAVDVSADGQLLLVGRSGGRVHLHDVDRDAVLPGPPAGRATPTVVRFRGDGRAFATGWNDGRIAVAEMGHTPG